jgi:hypothetical protein
MGRWFQRIVGGLVVIAGLILLALLPPWLTATDPIAAAKARAGAAGTSLLGSAISDSPLGGRARVRFQALAKGARPVEIELSRPFWSRHWR